MQLLKRSTTTPVERGAEDIVSDVFREHFGYLVTSYPQNVQYGNIC